MVAWADTAPRHACSALRNRRLRAWSRSWNGLFVCHCSSGTAPGAPDAGRQPFLEEAQSNLVFSAAALQELAAQRSDEVSVDACRWSRGDDRDELPGEIVAAFRRDHAGIDVSLAVENCNVLVEGLQSGRHHLSLPPADLSRRGQARLLYR